MKLYRRTCHPDLERTEGEGSVFCQQEHKKGCPTKLNQQEVLQDPKHNNRLIVEALNAFLKLTDLIENSLGNL
jgi:hypothetical protein